MMSEGTQAMLDHGSNVASVCSGSLGDAVLVALVREEMQVLFVQLFSCCPQSWLWWCVLYCIGLAEAARGRSRSMALGALLWHSVAASCALALEVFICSSSSNHRCTLQVIHRECKDTLEESKRVHGEYRHLKVSMAETEASVKYMMQHCSNECSFAITPESGTEVALLFSERPVTLTLPARPVCRKQPWLLGQSCFLLASMPRHRLHAWHPRL